MHIRRSIAANFLGGVWQGLLIVLTTPLFVARLGLEGFGLIGIWQLITYVSLIFDGGLGVACARELARTKGVNANPSAGRSLVLLFERPIMAIGLAIALFLVLMAGPLAGSWLDLRAYSAETLTIVLRLMALSVAFQFITAFYLNALTGWQWMGTMNVVQGLNNGTKYLGGAAVLAAGGGIVDFFLFQLVAGGVGAMLARWCVARATRVQPDAQHPGPDVGSLRDHARFSVGMFLTAACGALLANADRMVAGKVLSGEDLGKYMVSLTAVGLLQMVIFALYRSYFPRFSELHAAGDDSRLRASYLQACALAGLILVPAAILGIGFAQELFVVWLGWSTPDMVLVSRLLLLGVVLSGLMWLPAAYQQAIGWTRLHITLMGIALLLGVPLLILAVGRWGLPGTSALALVHGIVEITLGLWLMNRVCFPGSNLNWYRSVIAAPLLTTLPLVLLAKALMPEGLGRTGLAGWIGAVTVTTAMVALFVRRGWSIRGRRPLA